MNNGYAICFNEWALDKTIKNELGLLIIISSLSAKEGYCYASNEYFAKIFKEHPVNISKKIRKLEESNYIKIEYLKKGSLVIGRKIRLAKMLTAVSKNANGTVSKNAKDNNTSINITSINKRVYSKDEIENWYAS